MDKLIDIQIDSFSYHQNCQLRDINLAIKRGQFIVLTGLSGCGKTTLTRVINGLIPEYYEGNLVGDVTLKTVRVSDLQKGEIAKYMGNVFQNPKDQFFSTIVADEVALVGENLGLEYRQLVQSVERAMSIIDIRDLAEKSVFELSGGQRQKVAIASALVYDADIIIFDEPSASLDYQSTATLMNILGELKAMGKTIIIAEHRLYFLKDLVDRLIVMENGAVAHEYSANELNASVINRHSLRCLDEKNLIAKKVYKAAARSIEVKNLDINIHTQCLVQNINFDIAKGECMGVLGKNGVGKTTLAKMLCGLLPIASGKTNYANSTKERLKRVFYVMQDASSQLFAPTVELELIPKHQLKNDVYLDRVKRYLKAVDLWDKRRHHPHELSVGEKQRLTLILSFLADRSLIILDEPTAGLDFKRMLMVSDLIDEKSNDVPIMLITHDLELLTNTCHSVLLMDHMQIKKIAVKGNEQVIYDFINQKRCK